MQRVFVFLKVMTFAIIPISTCPRGCLIDLGGKNQNVGVYQSIRLGMFVLCTRTKVKFHLVVDRSNEEKRYSRQKLQKHE